MTAGRYDPKLSQKLPAPCGMEAVAEIVSAGKNCGNLAAGQAVCYMSNGAYADYTIVPKEKLFPIPRCQPEYVPLVVSALTANLALDKVGDLKAGEKVLVTAAAGGTGQFAVQLAKLAGCHVIGTCSNDDKVQFLQSLGCDRAINYKKEDLKTVLRKEYPRGIDVIYESIGGDVFDTCVASLARYGRLIVIGYIGGYQSDHGTSAVKASAIPTHLLVKSASIRGFMLFHFEAEYHEYFERLRRLLESGKLKSHVDLGPPSARFTGLEKVPDAVDYMYTGKNMGKIVVECSPPQTSSRL